MLDMELVEICSSAARPWKYIPLLVRTTRALAAGRPTHLFVQCPSIVLAVWAVLLKPLLGYRLVADLHNEAVEPFINRSRAYRRLLALIHRAADLSLVSNSALARVVEANGGRPFVLPDRIPDLPPPAGGRDAPPFTVVFICSFAPDEPYREVVRAATQLGDLATVHVTGPVDRSAWSDPVPENLRFTGYLPDEAYVELLRRADVVVDLTAMENCLVCGGYEAVALQKPLVTSDTHALRTFFREGAVYTRHDPAAIAEAVRLALERRRELQAKMRRLRRDLERRWEARMPALADRLAELGSR